MNAVVQEVVSTVRPQWQKRFEIEGPDAIRGFATCIGDLNPIHHSDAAAKARGLESIVAPGVMTLGFISASIAEEIPGVVLCMLQVNFKKPLYANSYPTVTCKVTETRRRIVNATVEVRNGLAVIADGTCTLLLPK